MIAECSRGFFARGIRVRESRPDDDAVRHECLLATEANWVAIGKGGGE